VSFSPKASKNYPRIKSPGYSVIPTCGSASAPGYSPIAVTMNDGTLVAGMMMKETDTEVVVRNIETKVQTVCKKPISKLSLTLCPPCLQWD
jgi:hypothetical protein